MALDNILGAAGAGSLGTLLVTLAADSTKLIRGMHEAELAVDRGAARMLAHAKVLAGGMVASYGLIAAAGVKAFADFESSFAGVRKTVDATEEEFKQLEGTFRRMARELPTSVNEINKIAESAGQLGVKKEALEGFTKTIIDLGNTTNLQGEEAASTLARIANVTGVAQKDFDRLGSTLVALGNAGASTEKEIAQMALRIGGAGKIVGLTAGQVLAFANTLSSLGVEAEAGGSAVSQTLIGMSKAVKQGSEDLKLFAAISGQTAQEFTKSFETDAAGAVLRFVDGLNVVREQGGDVFTILEELNIEGLRQTEILTKLSGASGMLAKDLQLQAVAWRENKALAEEASKRYETFTSQMTILWNRLHDITISIGEAMVPALKMLNAELQNVTSEQNNFANTSKTIGETIAGPLLTAIGLVGDAIQGWKAILLSIQIEFIRFGENAVAIFDKVARAGKKVAVELDIFSHITGIPLNKAIALGVAGPMGYLFGKSLPKPVDQSSIDATLEGLKQVRQETEQELADLFFEGKFSVGFKAEYDRMIAAMKTGNKQLADEVSEYDKIVKAWVSPKSAPSPDMGLIQRSNDAKKMLDSMRHPGQGIMNGALGMTVFDPEMAEVNRFALEQKQAKENLEILKSINEQELKLGKEHQEKKLALLQEYNERSRALQMAQAQIAISSAMRIGDSLTSIAKDLAGEQSGIYKAMFAVSKAFAIADATVRIAQGIAIAAANPFPYNLAAMASVAAATAGIVSSIQAVKMEFGGHRAGGGRVEAGSMYEVGERGRELFVPSQSGTIIPNNRIGGPVRVVVNNYTDARPEIRERDENGERVIEVMIRRVKNEMASEVRDGTGSLSKAMENTYGLRRGRV